MAAGENTPQWVALLEKRGVLLHEKMRAPAAALEDLRRVLNEQALKLV